MSLPISLPNFNHPEVGVFYEYDLSIPKEEVVSILQLPRATLIEDMKLMLMDTIQRDDFFRNYEDEDKWWEFHKHALWVLAELKAEEALPTVLELLKQDDDFNWYWFGDFATEGFWEILYHISGDSLDELKRIVLEPGEWVNRIVPAATLEQIALYQPGRRTEIIRWFRSILEEFLALEQDNPVLDGEVISSMVANLIRIQAVELLPIVKKLYDEGWVFNGIVGDYPSIERDISDPRYADKRKVFTSIFDRYQDAMNWHSYRMRYDKDYKKRNTYTGGSKKAGENLSLPVNKSIPFQLSGEKVGRNEPCPCGSGKKYKKCCWNK